MGDFVRHNRPASQFLLAALLPFIFTSAPVQAQSINPPTREELNPQGQDIPPAPPRLSIDEDIERSPCPLASQDFADIMVDVDSVIFNNLKGATAEEMQAAYAPYLGTRQPVAVICEIRDAAATILRNKGYLAAVQVPVQRIENGAIRFEVLYARITAVRIRGEAGRSEKTIAGFVSKLTQDEIFNRFNAERYLLLARDMPGYDVRLTLRRAGTGPGDLIGDVTVLKRPFEVDLNIQNLAAEDTGSFGGQLRAQFFGLTGLGDRTTISLYSTADFQEQQILQVEHSFFAGSEGLRLSGNFTYAWTEPDIGNLGPGAPELKARTLLASGQASYPIKRSQGSNINIAGGFDFVDQEVDFIVPLSRDELRVAWLRVSGNAIDLTSARDPKWRISGSAEIRRGLDILGASPGCTPLCPLGITPPSRIDGDPSATLVRAAASLEYAATKNLSFFIRPRAQIAFDPLLSFEEFSGGNFTIGRGYEPGVIIGDDGAGFQFETRGPRITLPQIKNYIFQPFGFFDAAWVWNDDRPSNIDPQRLFSVGGGIRSTLSDKARLDMTLAVPLRRAGFQPQRGDVRFLISFTTRLLPWGTR
jgi:hemolysin activation/secretion protein